MRNVSAVWVPSRFNAAVDMPGNLKAVYNTFSGALTIVPAEIWDGYFTPGLRRRVSADSIPDALAELHSKGFFTCEGVDEIDLVRQYFLSERYDRTETLGVNLLPTLLCNLRCPYCFEGKLQSVKQHRVMSQETADAVVRHLTAEMAGKKNVAMSWFGGEPLLATRMIGNISTKLLQACDEEQIAYSSVITTNGVLLSPPTVDKLLECRITTAQVTVDVPREMKYDRRGRDTLDDVLDNMAEAAGKLQIHVRVNLVQDDEKEWDHLFEGMIRRGLHKSLQSVNIANVFLPELGRAGCMGSKVAHESYVEVLRRQRQRARAAGLPMQNFLLWKRSPGCIATRESSVAIDPNGLLYKCNEDVGWPERAYGSVFSKLTVNMNNLQPWLSYDWFQHPECRDCLALPQCGGGCPHRRIFQGNSLDRDDYCYWFLRGDLDARIYERAASFLNKRG